MTLSIVVADAATDPAAAVRCLDALTAEVAGEDEVIWVRSDGRAPPGVRAGVTPGSSRGSFYGAGLSDARQPFVAFTDASTAPLPGWRAAAVAALDGGASVVGGPVLPHGACSATCFAGFVAEYGPHAVPPFLSAGGDVAANNVAYERRVLVDVVGEGGDVWKSLVNGRLAARGYRPVVADGMRVESVKHYGWRDVTATRVAHGRLYGSQRAATWSVPRRWATATAAVAVPALAFCRLRSAMRRDEALRRRFTSSAPLVLVAVTAWALGESVGYVSGTGSADGVF